ncbi:MAG: cation transporting ATPase C-terminal domain-containing protein [Gammaproteobacteria bacterium]|nr:cation transporting ATPase C-terminal domain-containing protein [Gammaproteobacteria bacterium]MCP5137878.1 cation transporting ATPase C-terminal domain-containing protein [Gammaproteobacteria bacterium]
MGAGGEGQSGGGRRCGAWRSVGDGLVGNHSRYLRHGVLNRDGLFGNPKAVLAAGLVMFFQLLYIYAPPMQAMFHSCPLSPSAWALIVLAGLALLRLVELGKALTRRTR